MSTNRKVILAGAVFWWFFLRRRAVALRDWEERSDVTLKYDDPDMATGNTCSSCNDCTCWPPG